MTDQLLQLIVSQAWQIATLAIIVAIVNRTVAKNRPHLAHALWMLVLIKCVTPPIWGHSLGLFSQLQAVAFENATLIPEHGETASIELSHEPGFQRPLDGSESVDLLTTDSRGPELEREFEPTNIANASDSGGSEVQGWANISAAQDDGHKLDSAALVSSAEAEPIPWSQVVLATVFLGAVVTFGLMIVRCVRCLRLIHRHRTTEFDAMLDERLRLLAKQLRMRRIPKIIVSDVLFGPAVLRLLRHTIVLPRCLLEASSSSLPGGTVLGRSFLPERTFAEGEPARRALDNAGLPGGTECTQVAASREVLPGRQDLPIPLPGRQDLQFLDPILAHELLHIRRGDLRTGTLQAIVQSLWWFHPAVWLCNRWLSREAERCCDEQVIAELGCSPAQYARSLLSVIESKHQLQPVPVFPGMKPVEITSQRMERIMSLKSNLKKQTPLWCWLAVVALAIVVLPGAAAKSRGDEDSVHRKLPSTAIGSSNNVARKKPTFEGNRFWSDQDLAKELAADKLSKSLSFADSVEILRQHYHNVGFFDVKILADSAGSSDDIWQFIIKEGQRYTVKETRYEGNSMIATTELSKGSELEPGGGYNSCAIAKDVERIHGLYRQQQLRSVRVDPVPLFCEAAGELALVFQIDEKNEPAEPGFADSEPMVKPDGLAIAEEPIPGVRTDRIQTTYDASEMISRLAKERSIDRQQAAKVIPEELLRRLNSTRAVNEHLKDPPTIEMDGERFVAVMPRPLAARFNGILELVATHGFDRYLVEFRYFVLPRKPADEILGPDAIVKITEAAAHGDVVLIPPTKLAVGEVRADRRIRAKVLSNQETDALIRKVTGVASSNEHPRQLIVVTHGAPARFVMFDTSEADESKVKLPVFSVRPESIEKQFLSLDCKIEMPVGVGDLPELTNLATTLDLSSNQTLVFHGLTSRTPTGAYESVLIAMKIVRMHSLPVDAEHRPDGKGESEEGHVNQRKKKRFVLFTDLDESMPVPEAAKPAEPRLVITYSVADLVRRIPNTEVIPAVATNAIAADQSLEPLHVVSSTAGAAAEVHLDFSSLVELIKASVEPESWDTGPGAATIAENRDVIGLVIRQTDVAHEAIAKLLSQLRKSQDSVQITCRLMKLDSDSQLKGLEERCSLHPLGDRQRWALLTKSRSEGLVQFLADEKVETLSAPRIMTISGQPALVEAGSWDNGMQIGFRLSANPLLIADSNVIRLSHSVTIGEVEEGSQVVAHESLVGSGQTLLLLVEKPAGMAVDRYVVLLTPEHLKEEEAVVAP